MNNDCKCGCHEQKCINCLFADIWPTGDGLCDFHDKIIEGNQLSCNEFSAKLNYWQSS